MYDFDNLQDMDDLIYVKFINTKIGYGVFAKKDLNFKIILGEYTGYI